MDTFEVEVISDPLRLSEFDNIMFDDPHVLNSPEYDLDLIKPALLFADNVNLYSSRLALLRYMNMHGWRITRMPMRQLNTYAHISADRDPAILEQLGLDEHDLAPPEEARHILAIEGDDFRDLMSSFYEKHYDGLAKACAALASIWKARLDTISSPEIQIAIDRGVLSVEGWGDDSFDNEAKLFSRDSDFFDASFAGMVNRLASGTASALVDKRVSPGTFSRSLDSPQVNQSSLPPLFAHHALSNLVGLADLPIIEVLDLREDLADYLPHFRSEMMRLSDDIADLSRRAVEHEMDRRWHRDIAPAVVEIRRAVAAARYGRKLVDSLVSDPATISATAGSVVVAAGGLAAGVAALIPAVAAAAYPFIRARSLASKDLEEVQRNKLFFLYAAQERLRS